MPSLPPKDPYNSTRERALRIEPAMATYVFPLIRTLTVGLGICTSKVVCRGFTPPTIGIVTSA